MIGIGLTPAGCAGVSFDHNLAGYAAQQSRGGFEDTTVLAAGVALALLVVAFGLSFLLPAQGRPETDHP